MATDMPVKLESGFSGPGYAIHVCLLAFSQIQEEFSKLEPSVPVTIMNKVWAEGPIV